MPIASGTDVKRYRQIPQRQFVLFPYEVLGERANLIDMVRMTRDYPRTARYLNSHRSLLQDRENSAFQDPAWHRFGRNQNLGIQRRQKLCVPRLVQKLFATFDERGDFVLDNVDVGGITLKPECHTTNIKFILGLLNSKLLGWFFKQYAAPFRGGWLSANRQFISNLPIELGSVATSDRVVTLAQSMIGLHIRLASAKTPHQQSQLQAEIDATDNRIDAIVYELYGLTPDEIAIVEAATAARS